MPYMTAYWERGEKKKAQVQINWTIKLIALSFTMIGVAVLGWLASMVATYRQPGPLARGMLIWWVSPLASATRMRTDNGVPLALIQNVTDLAPTGVSAQSIWRGAVFPKAPSDILF